MNDPEFPYHVQNWRGIYPIMIFNAGINAILEFLECFLCVIFLRSTQGTGPIFSMPDSLQRRFPALTTFYPGSFLGGLFFFLQYIYIHLQDRSNVHDNFLGPNWKKRPSLGWILFLQEYIFLIIYRFNH